MHASDMVTTVHLNSHATWESIAADTLQVKQMATALGLKGKGDKAYLIKQIMKAHSTQHK